MIIKKIICQMLCRLLSYEVKFLQIFNKTIELIQNL